MEEKSSSLMTGLIAVVIGLAVGFGVAKATESKTEETKSTSSTNSTTTTPQPAKPDTMTKSADLRVLLNALEAEHVNLASAAVRNGFDGDPDFDASAKALDANSVELSQAIGSVYGKDAEAKFLEIWRSHIGFFVDYTVAAKKGDQEGMTKAVDNLMGYVEAVSTFLSGANPNLPKDVVKSVVTDHVLLLKDAVDAYGKGDYTLSYTKQREAEKQIRTKIADAISGAIVKQYPEKF